MDELVVERTLRLVEAVPPGNVVSYGDVADALGLTPRQVGAVLARWGSDVPWWRVTNHAGQLIAPLRAEAVAHWTAEGIGVLPHGRGCDLGRHRWAAGELSAAARLVLAELPS